MGSQNGQTWLSDTTTTTITSILLMRRIKLKRKEVTSSSLYYQKDWRQEEKGTTEDEMVGWHHWPDGQEFEQALGVGDGQGNLVLLQSTGSQRVRHDSASELHWITTSNWMSQESKLNWTCVFSFNIASRWEKVKEETNYLQYGNRGQILTWRNEATYLNFK